MSDFREINVPVRVGLLFDGGADMGGVLSITKSMLESADRRKVTMVGVFLGPGREREVLGGICDEVVDLNTGCLLPLAKPDKGRYYLPNLFQKLFLMLRVVVALWRIAKRRKLQIIHVHFFPLHILAGLACRLARIPCMWHLHGSFNNQGAAGAILQWGLKRLADKVVCISGFVASTLPAAVKEKVCVVYNGVPSQWIAQSQRHGELRKKLGINDDQPVIGSFGNINEIKGLEFFIESASYITSVFPGAKFVIVGKETLSSQNRLGVEKSLRLLVRKLGLENTVLFAGYLDAAALYMADCNIVCVTTVPLGSCLGEGFGLVIAEAMAAGVPVISTNCGAPPEIIEDGVSGLLVPPRDPKALAGAIVELLQDDERRRAMADAGQKRIQNEFDLAQTARSLEQVYLSLLPYCR